MNSSTLFLLFADVVLLLHVLQVMFVVFGLVFIFIGQAYRWLWVRNPWFRLIHLLTITVVVIYAWLGIGCPLTTLEMALRERGGEAVYTGAFMSHWLDALLYFRVPQWVFAIAYSGFGVVVIGSWYWVRPRCFFKRRGRGDT